MSKPDFDVVAEFYSVFSSTNREEAVAQIRALEQRIRRKALEEAKQYCIDESRRYSIAGPESVAVRGALLYVEGAIRALSKQDMPAEQAAPYERLKPMEHGVGAAPAGSNNSVEEIPVQVSQMEQARLAWLRDLGKVGMDYELLNRHIASLTAPIERASLRNRLIALRDFALRGLERPGNKIDLDQESWQAIKKAASESVYFPPDYMMNEWVADVCEFLRSPHLGRPSEEAVRQAVARGWCDPANSHKVMDIILVESIVREILRLNGEKS